MLLIIHYTCLIFLLIIQYEHLVVHNNNTNFVQGSINILTIYIKYTTIG